jgi:hypothetical protein
MSMILRSSPGVELQSATASRPAAARKFLSFLFASRAAHWLQRLAVRVTATVREELNPEHAVARRYAGWKWSDTTERALTDDLTGRNRSFRP